MKIYSDSTLHARTKIQLIQIIRALEKSLQAALEANENQAQAIERLLERVLEEIREKCRDDFVALADWRHGEE